MVRLILLHIGLPLDVVNWIATCISSTNLVVHINGVPTNYLRSLWYYGRVVYFHPLYSYLLLKVSV